MGTEGEESSPLNSIISLTSINTGINFSIISINTGTNLHKRIKFKLGNNPTIAIKGNRKAKVEEVNRSPSPINSDENFKIFQGYIPFKENIELNKTLINDDMKINLHQDNNNFLSHLLYRK